MNGLLCACYISPVRWVRRVGAEGLPYGFFFCRKRKELDEKEKQWYISPCSDYSEGRMSVKVLPIADKNVVIKQQIQSWYKQWTLVDHLYSEFAQRYGLSSNSMYILRVLQDNPEGCTQRTISDILCLPKQTVSTILKNFEKYGYIKLKQSEQDKRNKIVYLSSKGKDYIGEVSAELDRIEKKAFCSLSDDDRVSFTHVNEALTNALSTEMHIEIKNRQGFV